MSKIFNSFTFCFLAGLGLPFAFAPFNLWFLSPLAIAILWYHWLKSTPWQALIQGGLFGLGFFGLGASWIFISIYRFGGVTLPIAGLITFLFIIVLALFPAIQGYLNARYGSRKSWIQLFLVFPLTWILLEWVRGWIFTGFPWLYLGYSQTDSPLRGWAPVLGVFGISWCVTITASLLVNLQIKPFQKKYPQKIGSVLALCLLWGTGQFLTTQSWTHPIGKPMAVSLIQGNIPQELKWVSSNLYPTFKRYQMLTRSVILDENALNQAGHMLIPVIPAQAGIQKKSLDSRWRGNDNTGGNDSGRGNDSILIIWPEGALPLPWPAAEPWITQLQNEIQQSHDTLILGIPVQAEDHQYYNAALVLTETRQEYRKRHLVPFGEYTPFEKYLGKALQFLDIPMSDFASGLLHQSRLKIQGIPIAIYICYEIAYGSLVYPDLPETQLLINLTNDAWFGNSLGPHQHLQIAQMRSLETGRYTICSSNDGITAIIDNRGQIVQSLPQFQTGVLTGNVQPMTGATPWIRMVNGFTRYLS